MAGDDLQLYPLYDVLTPSIRFAPVVPLGTGTPNYVSLGQIAAYAQANINLPLDIAEGGTGAVTAPLALTNLGAAPLASPVFTGDPRAPTPVPADNDTSIATTAFVKSQGYSVGAATWTPGAVIFATATTTLGQDPTQLFWDDTNNRLGVGTATPVAKLHVAGADSFTLGVIAGGTKSVRFGASALGATIEGADNTGTASFQPLQVGGSIVTLATGGTERMRVDAAGNIITASLGPASPQTGSIVATHLATSGPNIGINATFNGSSWNYIAGSGRCAYAISGDATTGNIAFFSAPAGNAGGAAPMTALMALQSSGNMLLAGGLAVSTASGSTNPILVAAAPNGYTSLLAPDATALGTGVHVGSVGSGNTTYYRNSIHGFQNSAGSTTYASFQAAGTYNVSGVWIVISDASVKDAGSIEPYSRGLDAISALAPVQFRYVEGNPLGADPSRMMIGLLAQDVAPHVPEIVGKTTVSGKEPVELDTLEPGLLIFALINTCKELAARVAALEALKR